MSVGLRVDRISKSYGAIAAVREVSFEVREGEIFGVIGPNGSGKSSLFNAILGQIKPTSGAVFMGGSETTGLNPLALARRRIGRTFQHLQVFGKLSVRDNFIAAAQEFTGSVASRLFAARDAGLRERAAEMLTLLNLAPVADRPAGSLSYGQQKLVDIGMALMPDPAIVLLDEPCAGVNQMLIDHIRDRLERLNRERRTTFVLIEHNMDFVMRLCHRVLVLAEGQVLALGTPDEVRAEPKVLEAYLGA